MNDKNYPAIALGTWAWGDRDGYFGNTMGRRSFAPCLRRA